MVRESVATMLQGWLRSWGGGGGSKLQTVYLEGAGPPRLPYNYVGGGGGGGLLKSSFGTCF